MKFIEKSCLFFFALYSVILLVSVQIGYAQRGTDSVAYYSHLALKPQSPNDLDGAYRFFYRSYEQAIAHDEIPNGLHYLYYLSSINHKKGAYDDSEKFAVRAIALLDTHKDLDNHKQLKKSFYNLLGMLYYEQRNTAKSHEFYTKVLALTDTPRDSAVLYNNIANTYKGVDDFENAKETLLKAYGIIPRLTDTLTEALILDNLGFIYFKLDNSTEDLPLMKQALQLRETVKDTSALYTSYSHLAQYYYAVDSLDASKKNALKALEFAEAINAAIYKHDALGLLTVLSSDDYAKAYKTLNDSLSKADQERANKFALLKYDYSEFERKALASQLEEEQQETRTIIAVAVALIIALLSVFLYFILKSKHKKEKLQHVFATESRISKQIHDEVANDVFQFMTKLEGETTNVYLIDDLQRIYNKTRDISKEHSLLEDDGPFANTIKDLVLSYSDAAISVIDKGSAAINWEAFSKMKRTTIYKVLQELLINMKKHSQASVAVLMFKKEGKKLVISYTDNGVGSTLKKSTGLHNVENRIESINGIITFDTEPNKGFKTKIVI